MTDPTPLLAAYLSDRWGTPTRIERLRRFHGGSSRETFRFDATPEGGATRGLVLRRDPPSSLIETDRRQEFGALKLFHGTAVPVPEPLFVEDDPRAFGSPGFVMGEIAGCTSGGLFTPDPYGAHRERVGEQFFSILGHIHATDPAAMADLLPTPAEAWRTRLDHWRRTIDEDAVGPEPVVRAAIRWLERNPPPPPQRLALVHGDYRSGNFIVDGEGMIRAILDWEMIHVGDPFEDLAWACDPFWGHGDAERVAGTLAMADAVAVWERASGLRFDAHAFRWWRVFAQVTGLAIWISSGREIADGRSVEPVLVFASLIPYRYHNASLARTLRELAA